MKAQVMKAMKYAKSASHSQPTKAMKEWDAAEKARVLIRVPCKVCVCVCVCFVLYM